MFRILSPSLRNVPFTGIEWSFMFKDEGYDYDGFPIDVYADDDDEDEERDESTYDIKAASSAINTILEDDDEDDEDMEMILIQKSGNNTRVQDV